MHLCDGELAIALDAVLGRHEHIGDILHTQVHALELLLVVEAQLWIVLHVVLDIVVDVGNLGDVVRGLHAKALIWHSLLGTPLRS